MRKASTGWINASSAGGRDWHDFREREFSWAELSLKLPVVRRLKDSHTTFTL